MEDSMPIRKNKLHKVCPRCGKDYEPNKKYQKICRKCLIKAMIYWQKGPRRTKRRKIRACQ